MLNPKIPLVVLGSIRFPTMTLEVSVASGFLLAMRPRTPDQFAVPRPAVELTMFFDAALGELPWMLSMMLLKTCE